MGASPGDHLKIYYYLKTNIKFAYGISNTFKKSANSAYLNSKPFERQTRQGRRAILESKGCKLIENEQSSS